jgi:hypothetical protein
MSHIRQSRPDSERKRERERARERERERDRDRGRMVSCIIDLRADADRLLHGTQVCV